MANYNWFKVFNKTEFEDLDLVSKEYEILFDGQGTKTVLVTKGSALSVTLDDVFLTIGLNGNNPFVKDGLAVYLDPDTDDVFVGFSSEN